MSNRLAWGLAGVLAAAIVILLLTQPPKPHVEVHILPVQVVEVRDVAETVEVNYVTPKGVTVTECFTLETAVEVEC